MKIKNIDLISISNELSGMQTDHLSFKGLLNEKLPLKTKYWLGRLYKEVESNKKDFVDIYKEWAETNQSESYQKFLTDHEDLALTEVDIKDYKFDIEEFDFETEYGYFGFISLFIDNETN